MGRVVSSRPSRASSLTETGFVNEKVEEAGPSSPESGEVLRRERSMLRELGALF